MEGHQPRHGLPAIARAGTGFMNIAPSRSKTDPPAPDTQKSERTHFHKRRHANTVTARDAPGGQSQSHNHSHRHRGRTRDTVHSPLDLRPPMSFEHLLRRDRDKRSPESSQRKREQAREIEQWRAAQVAQAAKGARVRVKPEDVRKAKAENEKREEELRRALNGVEEVGMQSTRRLDDTYYAILEKATTLRSVVANLQQLSEEGRKMHRHFEEDAQELERMTSETLDGFGDFQQQEKAIGELVEKLKGSKTETDALNKRLENARNRVEAYEHRENEKQSNRRKQWHATWGALAGLLVLVIAIISLKSHRSATSHLDGMNKPRMVDWADQAASAAEVLSSKLRPSPSEDPYLKELFEEL